jgi:hypothetical protein
MRQKWQYKTIKVFAKGFLGGSIDNNALEEELNDLGREGWELVTMVDTDFSGGGSREVIAAFKRSYDS